MDWLKKVGLGILLLVCLAAIVSSYDDNLVESCPGSPFCIDSNNYNVSETYFLYDGESFTFNTTINASGKGAYDFYAVGNMSANGTYAESDSVNIIVFEKSHIIPLCSNKEVGDVFCVNATKYNQSYLTDGESFTYSANIEVDANAPTPSNWTFFAFTNHTANGTEVESTHYNIEITEEVNVTLSVTINEPTNTTYTNKTVLFDVTSKGDDLKDCWYNIGSGNVSYTCNTTFQLDLSEDSYYFTAYANETSGNQSNANVSFNVNSYPLLDLNKPDDGAGFQVDTIDFNWTVVDSSNATFSCDYYLDSSVNTTTSCMNDTICNVQVTGIPENSHTWKVSCSDGVYANTSVTRSFSVDTVNPDIYLDSPTNSTYTDSSIDVNVRTNEETTCWYSNGSANVSMSTSDNQVFNETYSATQGSNIIKVTCNDTANNWNSTDVSFWVDSIHPQISITYPQNTSYNYNVSNLNYTFTETNPSSCWYNVGDGNVSVPCGDNVTGLTSNEDGNIWFIYINDTLGQESSDNVSFAKDSVNPGITFNAPLNQTYTYSNFTINVTLTETGSYCGYSNGSANVTMNESTGNNWIGSYTAIQGSQTVTVSCNDSVNLWNTTTVTFWVDSIYPSWTANDTVPVSGLEYNPNQSYTFKINFTDFGSDMSNITVSFNSSNTTYSYSDVSEANLSHVVSTLSAANFTYYYKGCDNLGNCNFTDVWTYEVRKADITSNLFINNAEENLTKVYNPSLEINVTVYDTNLSSTIYFNNVSKTNPYNLTTIGAGLYNVTSINEGNANYTGTNITYWIRISKAGTTTTLYLNNSRSNFTASYGTPINFTAYTTNLSVQLFVNHSSVSNPFTDLIGPGFWNITANNTGNNNYTSSEESWYARINKQNTSIALYIDGTRDDKTISDDSVVNFTVYLFNDSSENIALNVTFSNNFSGTFVEHQRNVSPLYNQTNIEQFTALKYYNVGGRFNGTTNYSVSAENWTIFITSLNWTVNFSRGCNISQLTYSCMNFTNNSFTGLGPCNQTSTCGLFNVTLEEAGSGTNATFHVKINRTIHRVPIYLSNTSNYTRDAINLSTSFQEIYANLTRGSSIMLWHFMDFLNAYPGTAVIYDLDFEARPI